MPVARSGTLWRWIFAILLIAVSVPFFWYSRHEFPHGGSPWGLAYGIAGFLLILLLAFFGIRKRWYRSTWGTLEQWLQAHIYLGLLVLAVLLFHAGGRFSDAIAVTALVLAVIVVFSGVVGAILYATIPRLLTDVESNLTVDEISDQLNQLGRQMARIASAKSPQFQHTYSQLMRQSVPGWLAGWRLLFSEPRAATRQSTTEWSSLLGSVPKDEAEDLRQMLVLSRQRRELLLRLIYQQRYKNVLEAWLYVHVPFTILLLVMSVVHVAAVFYYGPIR